ncbi:MAG: ribonuclease R [Alphaproteobacteria bacterium]|nr:ribonuclease R [Alphaproteobacteria bacterium]
MLSKEKLYAFIQSSSVPVNKRDIAREFGIKGGENRVALKQILKSLEKDEAVIKHPGGAYSVPKGLPAVGVVKVCAIDVDGDVLAAPLEWDEALQGPLPRIEIIPDNKHYKHLREDSRALVRLHRLGENLYEARTIRVLDGGGRDKKGSVLGFVKTLKGGAVLVPTDKKAKFDYEIAQGELGDAKNGDLAEGEILPSRDLKRKKVRITSVLGQRDNPKVISLISLHEAGLREDFPKDVLEETKGLKVPPLKGREDLREIPLVTIDGADARDFDDAVFAEKLPDGTHHLIVAIADVAHYVRPGSALDREAYRRGNSTYFPDRVVPMLPEALSNDLCSLRPKENRASTAVHLWIDDQGKLLRYKFVRALIRSAARLTYEQVQAARDGVTDDTTGPLIEAVIAPLYEAFSILEAARKKRGALDLDLPERQIVIDDKGNMTGVRTRARLDAHKLIEEFMILANVAAASALEKRNAGKKGWGDYPCIYRVHDKPSMEKLDGARDFLDSFSLSLPKGQSIQPRQINYVLEAAAKLPYSHLISQVILRTQSQAVYSPENIGHFGLALQKYAHFTSPIRRYADLVVHRALIGAYGLGAGEIDEGEKARIEEICQHISGTERTSMEAERSAVDRFTAAFLSSQINAEFEGRISGVTRFGLFVELLESGADGLVPMRSLSDDFYVHDEKAHALVGRKKGNVFRLGASVRVRIAEADGLTGSTVLELVGHERGADIPGMAPPRSLPPSRDGKRGRGKGRGHGGPERKGRRTPGKTSKRRR